MHLLRFEGHAAAACLIGLIEGRRFRKPDACAAPTDRGLESRQITGYFVGPDEYEEFKRFRESRRSFATLELPEGKVEAIRNSRMDPRHAHLDKLLDPK